MAKVSHDSETPAHGQQVISASAFIHDTIDREVKVFLAKRATTKKFLPGVYELPGGHIDYGEDIREGLKREIMEELGMRVSLGDPFYTFTYLNKIKGSHSIEVEFFGKFLDSVDKIATNPEDHESWLWATEKDVEAVLDATDDERKAIMRGFALIKTGKLNLG